MSNDPNKEMKKYAADVGDKIEQSAVFLSIFSKNYKDDPTCALQLGIAVVLDKPIGIIAFDGDVIPDNFKRLATVIEYAKHGDKQSLLDATDRLVNGLGLKTKPGSKHLSKI